MNQIEVTIMGNSYLLGCPEGGEATLRLAVARVDKEMNAIRDTGKLKARERIAVLAALNLAYDQLVAPVGAPESSSNMPANDAATIDRLVQRLDKVLRADGHLL